MEGEWVDMAEEEIEAVVAGGNLDHASGSRRYLAGQLFGDPSDFKVQRVRC